MNPLLKTDFYKIDHRRQYPEGTTKIYSNFTARQSRTNSKGIIFFGLQAFIKKYLIEDFNENFFKKDKQNLITEYKQFIKDTLLIEDFDTSHIEALHDLGYLPIEIKALPEGSFVPCGVPCLTITNTHSDFAWLVNYIETLMSCELWQACTSATTAYQYRQILNKYADISIDEKDKWFVDYQAHDFSMRGMGGLRSAILSGMGHLQFFKGTDTIPAILRMKEYYDVDLSTAGYSSVFATEHSVMCAGGKENERETYRRLICDVYPKGIVSIVSDTWDLWNVLTNILPSLKEEILARDGKCVIRPDSGDPVDIICGKIKSYKSMEEYRLLYENEFKREVEIYGIEYKHDSEEVINIRGGYFNSKRKYYFYDDCEFVSFDDIKKCEVNTPEEKGVIELLWETFGGYINEKGYKVLNPKIGAIYGDSITLERCEEICKRLIAKGFSTQNIVFGIGSYTYQYVTRDTYGFAMKATYAEINGEARELFKDPITKGDASKKSAKGLLQVYKENGAYKLKDQCSIDEEKEGELKTVFYN